MGKKGRNNLKAFFQSLQKLLKEDQTTFDLVIGSGDSGIAMARLTEMVYQRLGLKMPAKLLIPFYRFTQKDVPGGETANNIVLLADIKRQVSEINEVQNILFVDDEIGSGSTFKGIADLLERANQNVFGNKATVYILAEDHGWKPEEQTQFKIKFLPFASKNKGISNAISYVIPNEFEHPIKTRYSDQEHGSKERMNALMNLPIKTMVDGLPQWSDKWQKQLEKEIPQFRKLQKGFTDYLDNLLEEALLNARTTRS